MYRKGGARRAKLAEMLSNMRLDNKSTSSDSLKESSIETSDTDDSKSTNNSSFVSSNSEAEAMATQKKGTRGALTCLTKLNM